MSTNEAAIRARLEEDEEIIDQLRSLADGSAPYWSARLGAIADRFASLLADLTVLRASLLQLEQERDALQRDAEICIEHGAKEDHLRARDIRRLYEQLEAADARAVQLQVIVRHIALIDDPFEEFGGGNGEACRFCFRRKMHGHVPGCIWETARAVNAGATPSVQLQPCLTERRYTRAEVLALGVDDTELDALTASPTKGQEPT